MVAWEVNLWNDQGTWVLSSLGYYLPAMLRSNPCPNLDCTSLFCKLERLDSIILEASFFSKNLLFLTFSSLNWVAREKAPKPNQSFIIAWIIPPFSKKLSMNVAGYPQHSYSWRDGIGGHPLWGEFQVLSVNLINRKELGEKSWGEENNVCPHVFSSFIAL